MNPQNRLPTINTIIHLAAVAATLKMAVYCYTVKDDNELGIVMIIAFIAWLYWTLESIYLDFLWVKGEFGRRKDGKRPRNLPSDIYEEEEA